MGKKIKVKDLVSAGPGCKHFVASFDMGDGTERTEIVYDAAEETEHDEGEFLRGWLSHQFKYKADKLKLKNKTVIDIED